MYGRLGEKVAQLCDVKHAMMITQERGPSSWVVTAARSVPLRGSSCRQRAAAVTRTASNLFSTVAQSMFARNDSMYFGRSAGL
jgi:hypothetical protein